MKKRSSTSSGTDRAAAIQIKRAYSRPSRSDGYRVLVDRMWPRGVTSTAARIDLWAKELAPSTELRKWFGHDPAKWESFKKRFFRELDQQPDAIQSLLKQSKEGPVTLVFAAREEKHSNAQALKEYLESKG